MRCGRLLFGQLADLGHREIKNNNVLRDIARVTATYIVSGDNCYQNGPL